jgi:hypothetical protein
MKKFVLCIFLAMVTLAPFQVKDKSGMVSFYNNRIPYAAFFGYNPATENIPVQKGNEQAILPVSKEDPTAKDKERE